MIISLAAVALIAATLAAPAAATDQTTTETYLREHRQRTHAPGLAYAVIRGDRVLRHGALGADGNGRPMTTSTPFLLGSTSKSFTALAVTQLTETGRVTLDTPAVTYLPRLPLDPTVTIRRLLTHTSGLPQVWSSDLTDRYDNSPGGLTRSVRDLARLQPTAPVGVYQYSDANYMILGAVVEAVTGDTFGAYLRRHILGPLAMTGSAATADEARTVGVPPGHRYYLGRPRRFDTRFDTAGVPYGFLAASLDDLTHYTIAQLNDGRYGDTRILSPAGTTLMHTGTADTGHGSYGLGWQNSTLDGTNTRIVWHAGATPDYFTHIVMAPDENLAVIVMTNVYGLPMDPVLSAAAFNVARIELGATPAAADADPIHNQTLAGLAVVALLLLAALTTSLIRAARGRLPVRSRARTAGAAIAWTAGCAAIAAGAAWLVPSLWKGASLAKLHLWAPDLGHAIITVTVLAAALAVTKVALAARSGKLS